MSYADHIVQARRLAVLAALAFAPAYRMAVRLVREAIERAGYPASLDAVRADCAWLEETGLVRLEGETVSATDRGVDVVFCRTVVPGVRRPMPGEIEDA